MDQDHYGFRDLANTTRSRGLPLNAGEVYEMGRRRSGLGGVLLTFIASGLIWAVILGVVIYLAAVAHG